MPTFKITKRDGQVIEISDLSFAEIKELAGLNGHSSNGQSVRSKNAERAAVSSFVSSPKVNDYDGFKKALTDKARKFLRVLSANPNGISSDHLAEAMGFKSGSQLGGMTGGGIAKVAVRFGVGLESVYRHEVKFGKEGRVVTYYPGSNIHLIM
jgi:hypothetical protein